MKEISKNPPRIAAYLRVSTDEQREAGTIASQRNSIRDYCKYKKIKVNAYFEDEAVSGALPVWKRPQGEQLCRAVERREFDVLLTYKIDRLGRRIKYVLDFTDHCAAHGVTIIVVEDNNLDLSSPNGRLMLSILAAFAENERDVFRERSLAGKRSKAESGRVISHAPYGYLLTNDYRLEIDPLRAPVIKLIFERYAAGNSLRKIVEHLVEINAPLPVRSKGRWRHDSVILYLKNPAYYGEYHHFRTREMHDAKLLPGPRDPEKIITMPCPAIVSRSLWDEAQKMLISNRTLGPASKTRTYMLRGLIKCGLCGMTYVGHTVNPRRHTTKSGEIRTYAEHRYYNCGSETNRDTKFCGNTMVRADDLENQIWTDIENFIRNPETVVDKLLAMQREQSKTSNTVQADINRLQKRAEKLQKQKTNIVLAIGAETLTRADAASAIEAINEQIDQLNKERANLEEKLNEQSADGGRRKITNTRELLEALALRVAAGFSNEEKSQITRALVQKIVINPVVVSSGTDGNGGNGNGNGKIKRQPEATVNYLFERKNYSASVDMALRLSSRK